MIFVKPRQILSGSAYCSPLQAVFFWKNHLEEVNFRGHPSVQLSTSVLGKVSLRKKNETRQKTAAKNKLDRRLHSFCTKLDESNVKAGIRMAVGDDKIADFTVDPQREACSVPDSTDIDCFSTSEFFVHKAPMSFPNGSRAGLDGILPQILKDLSAKLNGQTRLNFLGALTNHVNVMLEGKVLFKLPSYFLGAKLIALKRPMGDFVLLL